MTHDDVPPAAQCALPSCHERATAARAGVLCEGHDPDHDAVTDSGATGSERGENNRTDTGNDGRRPRAVAEAEAVAGGHGPAELPAGGGDSATQANKWRSPADWDHDSRPEAVSARWST